MVGTRKWTDEKIKLVYNLRTGADIGGQQRTWAEVIALYRQYHPDDYGIHEGPIKYAMTLYKTLVKAGQMGPVASGDTGNNSNGDGPVRATQAPKGIHDNCAQNSEFPHNHMHQNFNTQQNFSQGPLQNFGSYPPLSGNPHGSVISTTMPRVDMPALTSVYHKNLPEAQDSGMSGYPPLPGEFPSNHPPLEQQFSGYPPPPPGFYCNRSNASEDPSNGCQDQENQSPGNMNTSAPSDKQQDGRGQKPPSTEQGHLPEHLLGMNNVNFKFRLAMEAAKKNDGELPHGWDAREAFNATLPMTSKFGNQNIAANISTSTDLTENITPLSPYMNLQSRNSTLHSTGYSEESDPFVRLVPQHGVIEAAAQQQLPRQYYPHDLPSSFNQTTSLIPEHQQAPLQNTGAKVPIFDPLPPNSGPRNRSSTQECRPNNKRQGSLPLKIPVPTPGFENRRKDLTEHLCGQDPQFHSVPQQLLNVSQGSPMQAAQQALQQISPAEEKRDTCPQTVTQDPRQRQQQQQEHQNQNQSQQDLALKQAEFAQMMSTSQTAAQPLILNSQDGPQGLLQPDMKAQTNHDSTAATTYCASLESLRNELNPANNINVLPPILPNHLVQATISQFQQHNYPRNVQNRNQNCHSNRRQTPYQIKNPQSLARLHLQPAIALPISPATTLHPRRTISTPHMTSSLNGSPHQYPMNQQVSQQPANLQEPPVSFASNIQASPGRLSAIPIVSPRNSMQGTSSTCVPDTQTFSHSTSQNSPSSRTLSHPSKRIVNPQAHRRSITLDALPTAKFEDRSRSQTVSTMSSQTPALPAFEDMAKLFGLQLTNVSSDKGVGVFSFLLPPPATVWKLSVNEVNGEFSITGNNVILRFAIPQVDTSMKNGNQVGALAMGTTLVIPSPLRTKTPISRDMYMQLPRRPQRPDLASPTPQRNPNTTAGLQDPNASFSLQTLESTEKRDLDDHIEAGRAPKKPGGFPTTNSYNNSPSPNRKDSNPGPQTASVSGPITPKRNLQDNAETPTLSKRQRHNGQISQSTSSFQPQPSTPSIITPSSVSEPSNSGPFLRFGNKNLEDLGNLSDMFDENLGGTEDDPYNFKKYNAEYDEVNEGNIDNSDLTTLLSMSDSSRDVSEGVDNSGLSFLESAAIENTEPQGLTDHNRELTTAVKMGNEISANVTMETATFEKSQSANVLSTSTVLQNSGKDSLGNVEGFLDNLDPIDSSLSKLENPFTIQDRPNNVLCPGNDKVLTSIEVQESEDKICDHLDPNLLEPCSPCHILNSPDIKEVEKKCDGEQRAQKIDSDMQMEHPFTDFDTTFTTDCLEFPLSDEPGYHIDHNIDGTDGWGDPELDGIPIPDFLRTDITDEGPLEQYLVDFEEATGSDERNHMGYAPQTRLLGNVNSSDRPGWMNTNLGQSEEAAVKRDGDLTRMIDPDVWKKYRPKGGENYMPKIDPKA
ncbi:hypothetical protein BGZ60DRAFT_437784 [Tricladium varicosporioides]|nr:hypothetical protein BGZ60DRAFT_437784 [Hymenoscyphus varicosporioides]